MLDYVNDGDKLATWLDMRNRARQYDFMETAFLLWQEQGFKLVTLEFIRELNFYAAHLLTPNPGAFRHETRANVDITNTPHTPPVWEDVEEHLKGFLSSLHELFTNGEPLDAAAYALWRLNWIHPFLQGNGRTSRALCYFLICQKYNLWLPGSPILPELIKGKRDEYCHLLKDADSHYSAIGTTDLAPLKRYLDGLLQEQLKNVP